MKGRKRHIVVDIMGNLLAVSVHAANMHDTIAGCIPAAKAYDKYSTIEKFCGDEGYRGTFVEYIGWDLDEVSVEISERIKPQFEVLPKRWIVERTLGWMTHSRRLSKDYEIRSFVAEAIVHISHLHTLLKRL